MSPPTPQLLQKAGIDQKLNNQVPLDTTFRDSTGTQVTIGKYFQPDKPVALALVYYSCNMLCPMTLDGITKSLKELHATAGKDFNVVIVSFNPQETPRYRRRQKTRIHHRIQPPRHRSRLAFPHRR